ncbi:MAG: hypothetical protein HQ517_16390 [SAR324 cluster bacterium]|nr:hypothetical protein [SAR324 cluster bacterium]
MPDFENEKEESEFWKTHDVRNYINWNNADSFIKRVFKDKKTEAEILKELKKNRL